MTLPEKMSTGKTRGSDTVFYSLCDLLRSVTVKAKVPYLLMGYVFFSLLSFAQPSSNPVRHVVIVVEENHSYESVIGSKAMPFLNSLAKQYSLATGYYANAHDSLPNYFWMTAGQHITYDDNTRKSFDVDNLVRHSLLSGLTWKSYAESIPSAGYTGYNKGSYVKRHNPFAYFTDVANSSERMNLVPIGDLVRDTQTGQLPNLSFVVPNLAHDGHDASLLVADAWLRLYVKPILATAPFQPGGDGLLIIVFDESAHGDCRPAGKCRQGAAPFGGHIPVVFAGPAAKAGAKSSTRYYHENLLSTVCYALGMSGCPGKGASVAPMKDMLK